ncbi:hypothetical protein [Streptomyces sp. NPDC007369]|uniref:hypothetical protein n=1 Tax=Streptomyces sp. NPDC007369 TaxID=3154589 RepID=UPI0033DE2C02
MRSRLLAEGTHERSWDPLARPAAGEPWDSTTRYPTPQQALADADAVMFDGRSPLDPAPLREIGFRYTSIGRP